MDYPVRTVQQLSAHLRAFRSKQGISQSTLAQRLGVTQQALSALERKPEAASLLRVMQVLSALGVDLVLRERLAQHERPGAGW